MPRGVAHAGIEREYLRTVHTYAANAI